MGNSINLNGPGNFTLSTVKKEKKTPNFLTIGSKKGRAQQLRTHEEEIINAMKSRYGLSDNQIQLMKPLLDSFYQGYLTSADIEKYANELIAAQQELNYNNESAVANRMRAAGINPDLTGLSEGNAEIPDAGEIASGTTENKTASSGSACKQKAAQITSTLMQAVSLGLNAYGIVAGQIGNAIASGSTAAGLDITNILGNEEGKVEDIDTAIKNLVNSKMFRNKTERKAYISEITRRINAIDVVTERLNKGTKLNEAKSSFQISKFKATNEYLENAKELIKTKQEIDLAAAKYDLEIANRNQDFLVKHPEYNEAQLEAELANTNLEAAKANAREAKANANVAEKTQDAKIQKAEAEGRVAEANANTAESNEEITKLRNENEETVQKFLKEAYEAVYGEETTEIKAMRGNRSNYTPKQTKRKAKRFLKDYQGRKKHASASVPGIGSIGFDY